MSIKHTPANFTGMDSLALDFYDKASEYGLASALDSITVALQQILEEEAANPSPALPATPACPNPPADLALVVIRAAYSALLRAHRQAAADHPRAGRKARPKARTKPLPATEDHSGKDGCNICGKPFKPGQKHRWIHAVHGGGEVLHPEDEALYALEQDAGDCGSYPIGSECAKKLGLEWSHAAGPRITNGGQ